MTDATPRFDRSRDRLPWLAPVAAAYRAVLSDLGPILMAAAPWMLLMAAWRGLDLATAAKALVSLPLGIAIGLAEYFVTGLIVASLAVWWHRRQLEGALTRAAMPTRQAWVYALVGWSMAATWLLPLEGVSTLLVDEQAEGAEERSVLIASLVAAFVIFSVVLIPIIARLAVLLPGIAIADAGARLGTVWARTRGSTWRLMLGATLTILPPLLGYGVVVGVIGLAVDPSSTLNNAMFGLVEPLLGMPAVAYLTIAWRHFFPSRADGYP